DHLGRGGHEGTVGGVVPLEVGGLLVAEQIQHVGELAPLHTRVVAELPAGKERAVRWHRSRVGGVEPERRPDLRAPGEMDERVHALVAARGGRDPNDTVLLDGKRLPGHESLRRWVLSLAHGLAPGGEESAIGRVVELEVYRLLVAQEIDG